MKTNIPIELNDEQRKVFGDYLGTGKMATRNDIRNFVTGQIDAIVQEVGPLGKRINELRAKGWSDAMLESYRRGWENVK